MKITQIKAGRWYETTHGTGPCLKSGGTFPPSVKVDIRHPLPLGVRLIAPRDVKREVDEPKQQDGGT